MTRRITFMSVETFIGLMYGRGSTMATRQRSRRHRRQKGQNRG